MSIVSTNRVTWKDVVIGNHSFVSFSYMSNNDVRVVPRAKGVIIHSTQELGGGYLVITVSAVVAKDTRIELEEYFNNLDSTFDLTVSGTLEIVVGETTVTLSDCYLDGFDQEQNDAKINNFTFKFIKSL